MISLELSIVDLVFFLIGAAALGAMIGHRFLPPRITRDRDRWDAWVAQGLFLVGALMDAWDRSRARLAGEVPARFVHALDALEEHYTRLPGEEGA